MMVPWKLVAVSSVAELPTCQKTLAAVAPLVRITRLLAPVVSVDAIWKIQTAFGSFWASSVRSPAAIANEEEEL